MTVSGFDGSRQACEPGEEPGRGPRRRTPAATATAASPFAIAAAATGSKYRIIDFKRNKARHARQGADPGVRPQPQRPHRPGPVRGRREALHPRSPRPRRWATPCVAGADADIKPGNALPLANIPVGTFIHNVELYPGKGAQLVRSAGVMAQLMAKEGDMRYGPPALRRDAAMCPHELHGHHRPGRQHRPRERQASARPAARRHMGWRPTVRGSVMNPCDHPHGGGEGKSPIGRPGPVTPWGKPDPGLQDPQEARTVPTSSSSSAAAPSKRREITSIWAEALRRVPFVQLLCCSRGVEEMNKAGEKSASSRPGAAASTIFPSFVGHTFAVHDGRRHVPRVRHRGHGRSQAGRVRAHPHVPRPRRQQDCRKVRKERY